MTCTNKRKIKPNEYMEINILKRINLSKGTSNEERTEIENLIRKYKDVFT